MQHIIVLDKEDINTSILGENYMIQVNDKLAINLTQDAADELINDLMVLRQARKAEK